MRDPLLAAFLLAVLSIAAALLGQYEVAFICALPAGMIAIMVWWDSGGRRRDARRRNPRQGR